MSADTTENIHVVPEKKHPTNGFLIRNSRFLKKQDRDQRLIRSPCCEDFIVAKIHNDLIEKFQRNHVLVEVYDPLLEEDTQVQVLVSLATAKRESMHKTLNQLLDRCSTAGILLKDAEIAQDTEIRNLHGQCQEQREALARLDEQIAHVRKNGVQSQGWTTPIEFKNELLPVFPLDPSLLPEPLRFFAEDVASRLQCPLDFVGIPLLVVFSSIIGAGCAMRPLKLDSWKVIVNLWGGIVGPPGSKKTPALNAAMAPLGVLEKEADDSYKIDKIKKEADKIELEARKKNIKGRIEKSIHSEEEHELEAAKTALISLEREESATKWRRYKTNDSTIEKLGELLSDNPRGLLVYRDELVGFLASLEKEGREDSRAFYLEAWAGYSPSSVKSDRIKRGTITCNPCISVLGSIQPSKLKQYLQEAVSDIANDGLAQRLQLLIFPDKITDWTLIDRKPDHKAKERVIAIARLLANTDFISLGAIQEEDFPLPSFHFEANAQYVFNSWLETLEKRFITELDEGMLAEHLSKFRSLMPSLALICHLIRCADAYLSGINKEEIPKEISLEDTKRAAELCAYLESHAKRIYAMAEQRGIQAAKNLLKKIREGGLDDGFTQREVRRKEWKALTTCNDIDEACLELIARGWLKEEPVLTTPRGGAPTTKYKIHPILQKKPNQELTKLTESS